MCRRAHFLFLCLLISPISLIAQSTNATITGTVNDSSHRLIANADIEIVNDATGVHYAAITNRDGIYTISVLPPGKYTVQASHIGFKTIVTPNIVLNIQGAVSLNFALPVGAASETLTVEAGTTLLNTTDASVSTVVDQKFIANMPLNGRSLQSLVSLTPGVVQTPIQYGSSANNSGEFAINGQRTEGNYYTVDGVSATVGVSTNSIYSAGASGGVPNETALGTTQSIASVDALQEFRISTSTYSAEYGRTPGGQIALQTRSGTNSFHGSIFDYFRNDALDATNWFNNHVTPRTPKTAERQNDFGGTFSGPLLIPRLYRGTDRTFFFYSYEGLRLSVPTPALTIQVPDASLRAATPAALQPFVDAFPVPNGAEVSGLSGLAYFTGAYSLPSGLNTNSIRVDHHIGDKTELFARYFDSSSHTQTRSSSNPSKLATTNFISRGITAGLTRTLTEHLFNEARYNYTWNATQYNATVDNFGGAQPATLSTYLTSSVPKYSQLSMYLWWGAHPNVTISVFDIGQTQTNIVDTFQYQHGKHLLRFGGDYRRLELNNGANQFAAVLLYISPSNITTNSASYGNIRTDGVVPAAPIFQNLSFFAQDEWKVLPSTSLSLGLRWDINPPPTNGSGIIPPTLNEYSDFSKATLLPSGTPLWNTDYRGVAPRLGVATQINSTKGRESVLRYGIGLFYDTGNTATSQGFNLLGLGAYRTASRISFPLPSSFYVVPSASTVTPYNNAITAFNRNLRLPMTYEWNLSLEQALGTSRSITIGYVAAAARRLLNGTYKNPSSLSAAFSNGYGVYVFDNGPRSNYQSLQTKFQQTVTHGLQILGTPTWSHSMDDSSTNFISYQPLLKGDSDFDIRTNAQVALTYQTPAFRGSGLLHSLGSNWGIDLRAFARTAAPVDVFGSQYVASDGSQQYSRPNVIAGNPLYIYGDRSIIPGGKQLNYLAFQDAGSAIGNAPRNFLRGFGAAELDFAARREFVVADRFTIQARAEAFNISNRPNFGAIYNSLSYGATQFGKAYNTLNVGLKNQSSLYQQGGPRSVQLALKILF